MSLPATYSFPEASGVQLSSPPWLSPRFVFVMAGDGAGHATPQNPGSDSYATWTADTFTADHYSQVVIANNPGSPATHYVYLYVRTPNSSGSGAPDGYQFQTDGQSDSSLYVMVGGSGTALATDNTITYTSGDVFKLECVGSLITVYKNGTSILSASDSTYNSGFPGIGGDQTSSGVLLGSFEADNASGGSPGVHTVSGSGSFTVSAPTWLSTAISGRPAWLSSGAANPPNWYHVGMLSWGTANGAMVSYPVTRDLDLVEIPAGLDTVWYEFAIGVTAVITELSGP